MEAGIRAHGFNGEMLSESLKLGERFVRYLAIKA